MVEKAQYMIERFLDGDYDALEFSYDLPDFIVDNYDTLQQEDAALAKRLDDTFPEICAEYERGFEPTDLHEKIKKAYLDIYTRSMLLRDMPKNIAVELIDRTKELRPGMKISIIQEDTNLQRLGFAEQAPCIVEIISSPWEIDQLVEEVDNMEVDAFIYSEEELRNPANRKRQRADEEKWHKYSIIELYLSGRYGGSEL